LRSQFDISYVVFDDDMVVGRQIRLALMIWAQSSGSVCW